MQNSEEDRDAPPATEKAHQPQEDPVQEEPTPPIEEETRNTGSKPDLNFDEQLEDEPNQPSGSKMILSFQKEKESARRPNGEATETRETDRRRTRSKNKEGSGNGDEPEDGNTARRNPNGDTPGIRDASGSNRATQSMEPSSEENGERSHFDRLPNEILEKIFSSLPEKDLVRASGTSKRLFSIADKVGNVEYWKKAYQDVFEYRKPLFHPAPGIFEFRDVEQWKVENPWKESYKQLSHGIHVRPGHSELYNGDGTGRELNQFETLGQAMAFLETQKDKEPLIFLHSGRYDVGETIRIRTNLQIIGAAPEANQVIVEQNKCSHMIRIVEEAHPYLGHLTIKGSPDPNGNSFEDDEVDEDGRFLLCAVAVCDQSSPRIEHCRIQSSVWNGAGLVVREEASPKVRNCTFSDSDVGIEILDDAEGVYQECEIARNRWKGVCVNSTAKPVLRNCQIHHGEGKGVEVKSGEGLFDNCGIRHNDGYGIYVMHYGNPTFTKCEIHGNQVGVLVDDGRGHFSENQIHHNIRTGIEIYGGYPTIHNNEINDQNVGVDIFDEGSGSLEHNHIHGNSLVGIQIRTGSHPILHNNDMDNNGQDVIEIDEPVEDSDNNGQDVIDEPVEDSDSEEDSVNGQEEED